MSEQITSTPDFHVAPTTQIEALDIIIPPQMPEDNPASSRQISLGTTALHSDRELDPVHTEASFRSRAEYVTYLLNTVHRRYGPYISDAKKNSPASDRYSRAEQMKKELLENPIFIVPDHENDGDIYVAFNQKRSEINMEKIAHKLNRDLKVPTQETVMPRSPLADGYALLPQMPAIKLVLNDDLREDPSLVHLLAAEFGDPSEEPTEEIKVVDLVGEEPQILSVQEEAAELQHEYGIGNVRECVRREVVKAQERLHELDSRQRLGHLAVTA